MEENIYITLTRELNSGRLRATLAGGQAVVLHRLAIMSKDGDWVLREDLETMDHALQVLNSHRARYRFGAPLDVRWMGEGWSTHLEFMHDGLRTRTDFVTRPPRLDRVQMAQLWNQESQDGLAVAPLVPLAVMKKTNREKDYAVIGELARLMSDPDDQFLHSRSARDILALLENHPATFQSLLGRRPALKAALGGRDALEAALDAERRELTRANETRLEQYMNAATKWAAAWPRVQARMQDLPLLDAHQIMVSEAEALLPFRPDGAL